MTVPFWRSSSLRAYQTCKRKFYYQYELGISDQSTGAQRYGTAFHSACEAWLKHYHEGSDTRQAAALAAIHLADPWDAARARASMIGYECRWGHVQWHVLGAEVDFEYEIEDELIRGRIDGIVQDETDGRVYVVEHKTTSSNFDLGSSYWAPLTIDTQVSIYVEGASALGYDVAGVIYDAIARPKHAPRLATPVEKREYTKGKGCRYCGGTAAGKSGIVQGRGLDGNGLPCVPCYGTGWKDGTESPRIHANQRDTDEDVAAFEARVGEAIKTDPQGFYQRAVVVRTANELPRRRADIADTIELARHSEKKGLFPPNPGACRSFGSLCSFLDACEGRADINDPFRFPRSQPSDEMSM